MRHQRGYQPGSILEPNEAPTRVPTRMEGNVLFTDALNTFYLQLYGIGHTVKNHSDCKRGNLLPPHGLLLPNSSKGYFICTIRQAGYRLPQPLLNQSWSTGWNEK